MSEYSEIITQPMSQNADDSEIIHPMDNSVDSSWGLLLWVKYPNREPVRLRNGINEYQVGRGDMCDIQLTSENVNIEFGHLSRIHFTIKRIHDKPVLEDCSVNGTVVNDKRVAKGLNIPLHHQDVISLTCGNKKLFTFLDTNVPFPGFPQVIKEKYVIASIIGKGSFGEVALVVRRKDNKKHAIKSVLKCRKKGLDGTFDPVQQLKNEATLLLKLNHPCVVQIIDILESADSIHLVLELMNGGDLQSKLSKKKRLKESTSKYYFMQLVLAVQYCHMSGVVHRDLKPENILLSSKEEYAVLKITDFGLSKLMNNNTNLKTYCGTPLYLAPEVVEAKCLSTQYTSAVDVWSLGVILFILLSGYHPFRDTLPCERLIIEGRYILKQKKWDKVSLDGLSLVKQILQVDPNNRPTLTEILRHPWMMDEKIIMKVKKFVFADVHSVSSSDDNLASSCNDDSVSTSPLHCVQMRKKRRIESYES